MSDMTLNTVGDREIFAHEESFVRLLKSFDYAHYSLTAEAARRWSVAIGKLNGGFRREGHTGYSAFQFWDTRKIPEDVQRSIRRNGSYFGAGRLRVFDLDTAQLFIGSHFSERVGRAFQRCVHPAMQSDFFRLLYLYVVGGLYIDADLEVFAGFGETILDDPDVLWVSIALRRATQRVDGGWDWYGLDDLLTDAIDEDSVCYLQNDILAASPGNEIIRLSIMRAVILIERAARDGSQLRAHTATGPTNITVAMTIHLLMSSLGLGRTRSQLRVFDRARCIRGGTYEYKKDERNWQIAGA